MIIYLIYDLVVSSDPLPSGDWEAVYTQHGRKYQFSMHLSFSTSGEISGYGEDNNKKDWNANGFDIKGSWSEQALSFEKSYRGGDTILYDADIDLNDKGPIRGYYSFLSGEKGDEFTMNVKNDSASK